MSNSELGPLLNKYAVAFISYHDNDLVLDFVFGPNELKAAQWWLKYQINGGKHANDQDWCYWIDSICNKDIKHLINCLLDVDLSFQIKLVA